MLITPSSVHAKQFFFSSMSFFLLILVGNATLWMWCCQTQMRGQVRSRENHNYCSFDMYFRSIYSFIIMQTLAQANPRVRPLFMTHREHATYEACPWSQRDSSGALRALRTLTTRLFHTEKDGQGWDILLGVFFWWGLLNCSRQNRAAVERWNVTVPSNDP